MAQAGGQPPEPRDISGKMREPGLSKAAIVARALQEGFVSARVCRPDAVPDVMERLKAFLEAGYHGQMGWMADRVHWRGDL